MTKKIDTDVTLVSIMEHIATFLNHNFVEKSLDKAASDSIDSGKFMLPGGWTKKCILVDM